MLSKFSNWYNSNDTEITWFLMGSLIAFGIADVANGYYLLGFISFALAYLNYATRNWK